MHRILVVDDDLTNTKLLKFLLTDEGYDVTTLNSSLEALAATQENDYDLLILDIMMPEMDGLELCQRVRQTSQVPIIFISARGEVKDKVGALRLGGDDYISKPFDPNEVLARTWATLRRSQQLSNNEAQLRTPDLVLDAVDNQVTLVRNSKIVNLTPIEAKLLRLLVANAGRTLTRDTLVIKVWGYDFDGESNQLDVYMKRLRHKIEEQPAQPKLLLTIRGVGYKYQPSTVAVAVK